MHPKFTHVHPLTWGNNKKREKVIRMEVVIRKEMKKLELEMRVLFLEMSKDDHMIDSKKLKVLVLAPPL